MVSVFTIVSCNYLADARVLMRSVAQHLPSARRMVFLTDEPRGRFDSAREDFEVIRAQSTGLPGYRQKAFAFSPAELCFVLKPFCADYLCSRDQPEALLYLDADTLLLAPPHELLAAAQTHGLAITPHLISAERNARTSLPTMRSGVFNGGVFAVNSGPEARRFLRWWGQQLSEPINISADWNHDQGWLALTPALFPDYSLVRHPGYNVAFWNLHERDVTAAPDGSLLANGLPLTLFHFSYFNPSMPDRLTGSLQTNFPPPNSHVVKLLADYATQLKNSGYDECRRWAYGYGSFSDGHPVTAQHRRYFKSRILDHLPADADPFDPKLQVPGFPGLKSLYHVDHWVSRAIRRLRNTG